ncbi:MAG: triose-phosphate isomerase [Azonexus sp.]|nr:triose-phosphate isomerase [Azonexus sp.]MCK6411125.1 triose-phosphate isomerase [Azonexus sp.]
MRKKLVAGNWKMNGSLAQNRALLASLCQQLPILSCEVAVFPPFPYLSQASELLHGSSIRLGAQTLSEYREGAYTGEVAAGMLREVGCSYVLVGHSERRSLFAESDQAIARKFLAALASGLNPILCFGETLEERQAGVTLDVIKRQVLAVLACLDGGSWPQSAILAYEPVWAIGTGLTATPLQAQEVHAYVRSLLNQGGEEAGVAEVRILYGGSVRAKNARELFCQPDIDGGLIGGASLNVDEFLEICRAAT